MGEILDDLLEHDLGCAPHVVARLVAKLSPDPQTIRAVAAQLDVSQRRGLRPLPSPLPIVDSIARSFADLLLGLRDHDLLVAVALRLDDRLDPLLDFDGRTAHELVSGDLAAHLVVHAGRVRLVDPRLSIWLLATTAPSVLATVHERLHAVSYARSEKLDADWHRARASLYEDPETAAELIRIAREQSRAGADDRALQLAAEAAVHASGAERDEAALIAGISAIAAGYAAEAVDRLSTLFPDGVEHYRLQGLGGLIVAQAHLQGAVPDVEPDALKPRTDDPEDWYSWARAAAFAAVLSAERGDRQGMRSWLGAVREGCGRAGAANDLRDPVVALAWLLVGDREPDDVSGSGPLTGGMLQALRAAVDGDTDRALRALAVHDSGFTVETDPFVEGFERSPLVGAYRAIVEVLLLMWRGDIGAARSRMIDASLVLPVALPFSGLGVIIARRLDLAVIGAIGPFARSLTAALPTPLRIDHLVDRSVQAYLAGAFDEASSFMRVWLDRGAPQPTIAVPGLEEVLLVSDRTSLPPRRVQPPEIELAQRLRVRIARCSDDEWRAQHRDIVQSTKTIRSPFSRGRVEAMIGTRWLIRGDLSTGRAHLETARGLLEVSGALAWSRAVAVRIERLDSGGRLSAPSADPLATAEGIWESMLTTRELEAAMQAVRGASNRDIAEALHVSVRTVEVHLGRVFAKLEVRSRVELTVLAHRIGQYV